jgi:hypothetical protein
MEKEPKSRVFRWLPLYPVRKTDGAHGVSTPTAPGRSIDAWTGFLLKMKRIESFSMRSREYHLQATRWRRKLSQSLGFVLDKPSR